MRDSKSSEKKPIQEVETMRQHKLRTERLRRKVTWQKKIQTTIGADEPQAARKTGIDIIGNVPWGTHLCVFYQDKQDLIDILVPYFKEGLENNEFCMWITSEPLNAGDAEQSLRQAVNNLDEYIEKGQIEILDYSQWYTKSGRFDPDEVLRGWSDKYEQAIKRGFDGLRVTGNALWLEKRDWLKITRYEAMANDIFGDCRVLAICTYSLNKCGTSEAIDVVCNHQFALIRRDGRWELVESSELKNTNRALQNALKQWETTFNTTQDSIILIDPDFTILKANLATSNLLGKPLDNILGSRCYELFHGTNTAPDICPYKRAKETKKHEEAELYIPDKDIWIAVSVDPILDANGNISSTVHLARNITERERAEEALRKSEERYRTLCESSLDGIATANLNGTITDCNRAYAQMLGYSSEELKKIRYQDITPSKWHALNEKVFLQVMKRGYSDVFEKEYTRKDGTVFPVSLHAWRIDDEDGNAVGVGSVVRDITERKKMEESLRDSKEKMRSLLEISPDFIIIVDHDHTIQFINRAASGQKVEKVIGKSAYELIEPQYHEDFEKALYQTFATGQSCSLVVRGIDSNGKLGWFENRLAPIKQDGAVGAVMVVSTDITKRRKADEKLKQSREFLTNTINALDDTFFVKDEEHRWTILNDAACKAIGRPREKLIGKSDYDLFPKEQADVFWEKDNLVLETGETSVSEEEVTWRGKLHTISTKKSLFKDYITGKRFIVGTARDITEQKQMEKTLRESEQKYRALVEQSLHGIVILQDFRVVFVNKAASEIVGLTMEELLTLSLEEMMAFIPPESRAVTRERLKNRFARKNEPGNYELRLVRRNGEEFWLNLFFSNIEYQGKFAIQLAFTDITEKKRAEEALRRSEKWFREFFENTAVGVYRTTPDGQILMANPALVHTLGYSSFEELSHRNLEEEGFEPQYSRSMFKEEIERKGHIVGWESIWKTRDNKILHVIENARVVRDEGGRIMHYEGTAENVTERKRAEKELKQSKEFLANIINALDDPVFVKDGKHRWAVLNDAACEVMGRSREELIGKSDYDLFSKEQADVFWERDNHVLETGQTDVNEEEITWHGKLHTISTKKSVYTDSLTGKKFIAGSIRDITDRKKAEEALRDSEQRYRAIFEQAADSIVLIDVETGELVEFNDRAHKNLGYTREEFRSLKIPDFDVIESAEETRKHLEKITRTGADTFETKHRTKEGEIRDIQISSRAISIRDKDFVQSIWYNITEQKKAQEAVFKEKIFTENAINAQTDTFFLFEPGTGKAIRWNKAFTDISGYTDAEIARMPAPASYYSPEDLERAEAFTQMVLKEGTGTIELELICRDGRKVPTEYRVSVINDDQGEPEYIISIGRDVTERKRAQEALHKSETRYRELFDNMSSGVAVYEPIENGGDFVFKDLNRAGERINNVKREDVIGQKVTDVFPGLKEFGLFEIFQRVCETGRPEHHPVSRYKDDRLSAWFENYVYKLPSGEIVAVHDNVTERKRAEEKLREYQEQLKSLASELTLAEERERRRIAIELHDEISQSIFISKMKLEEIQKSGAVKTFDDTLDEINNSLGRIIATMRSLTFDLSSPILYEFGFEEAVAGWLTEQVEGKYGIQTEFEDDGLPKPLDDDISILLFRNVRELLINVVKHARAKKIKVSTQKLGSRIRVSVEDDGVGFDSAKAESMITNKKAFGLFSIRERLEHLGGNLEIESESGCGCRITITSPLSRDNINGDK